MKLPEPVRKAAPIELREDGKDGNPSLPAYLPFREETLKLLMPSEAFLSSFKVGLDPKSAKHFQQGIDAWKARQGLQGLRPARYSQQSTPLPHPSKVSLHLSSCST